LAITATLSELKSAVCQHLAVPVGDDPLEELDCNCSAARQIDANAALNERGAGGSDALHTLVVVYGDNKVAVIPVGEPTLASIQHTAREQLQEKAVGKLLCAIGGLESRHARESSSGHYLKLPVLAVCSRQSHRRPKDDTSSDSDISSDFNTAIDDRGLTLDLHTSECPIDITVHNKDVTLVAAGLDDCAINGVLTIFAVRHVYSIHNGHRPGKLIACCTYRAQTKSTCR